MLPRPPFAGFAAYIAPMNAIRPILLLVAAVSFGLGISLPLIRLDKLYFFTETPSLLDIVAGLWTEGDSGLAAIVAAFSLVFPLAKLFASFQAAFSVAGHGRYPAWAGWLAKWSMMDVMLVAIVVFAAKTSGFATAASQPGVWFYAVSAFCSVLGTIGLTKRETPA